MKGAFLVPFREQNSFGAIWFFQPLGHFLLFDLARSNWARPLLIRSLNSQNMIFFMITTGPLYNHNMTRILKQWRHDFSGKHLRDRHCIYVVWCLCGGQSSLFFKASLRICYVNLFECKGLLMSKTVINFRLWNRRLQNYTEKVPCTALFNYLRTFAFNIFCF